MTEVVLEFPGPPSVLRPRTACQCAECKRVRFENNARRAPRAPARKLTASQVRDIRTCLHYGDSHSQIAASFGVTKSAIDAIASGRTWGWLK